MVNNNDPLEDLFFEIKELKSLLRKSKAKRIYSSEIRRRAKSVAHLYFRQTRVELSSLSIKVAELDGYMQDLIEFSNKSSQKSTYYTLLNKVSNSIIEVEKEREYKISINDKGKKIIFFQEYEKKIYQTLLKLPSPVASSYKQVLLDLSDQTRISFRGTISEMREILRETLDCLAPDDVVIKQPGFKLEKDRKKPTMSQKARFILTSRGMSKAQIKVPEGAISILEIAEDKTSSFIRDLYSRKSISVHTKIGKIRSEALQLKMYLDSILCELLELHNS